MAMDSLDIKEQENWEVCMAKLDDAVKCLRECRGRLEKALGNVKEVKDEISP